MLIPIKTQLNVLIYSIVSGILIGILFDLYRLLRGFVRDNNIITFFEDMLFWIFTSIIIFIFLLYTNYAFIEVYVFLYIALGMFCYFKFISRHFIYIQYKIVSNLNKSLRIFFKLLIYPFQLIKFYFKLKITENKKK